MDWKKVLTENNTENRVPSSPRKVFNKSVLLDDALDPATLLKT